ncbi:hypothetical protein [Streptomyces sp. NBC_00443]|uniref:hypothetical protein n=1 Tax=Streptomyces sp. NBC_00443 TaxID=2975743 RepID=UPI002E235F5D
MATASRTVSAPAAWGGDLSRSASDRRLALKAVHAQYTDDEFRTLRQVSGAFTAPVVDAHADADAPRRALDGLALHPGHRAGMAHRDLKPANVVEDGPRAIDFGATKVGSGEGHTTLPPQVPPCTGRVAGAAARRPHPGADAGGRGDLTRTSAQPPQTPVAGRRVGRRAPRRHHRRSDG